MCAEEDTTKELYNKLINYKYGGLSTHSQKMYKMNAILSGRENWSCITLYRGKEKKADKHPKTPLNKCMCSYL